MKNSLSPDESCRKKNADRFTGFADIYDEARPECPDYIVKTAKRYLGRKPECVVDLGCGTGLSTLVWQYECSRVVGAEPSADMLIVAARKSEDIPNISFIEAFADDTGLPDNCADIVTCSQSFHWMEPKSTLKEINRILKPGGIFMAYDCDWPPVCGIDAEIAYEELNSFVTVIEANEPSIKDIFDKRDKNRHLENIKNSGYFRYTREIVFANVEECDAGRIIAIALSQGGLQSVLKLMPEKIEPQIDKFKVKINAAFGDLEREIEFCYRIRMGIKMIFLQSSVTS